MKAYIQLFEFDDFYQMRYLVRTCNVYIIPTYMMSNVIRKQTETTIVKNRSWGDLGLQTNKLLQINKCILHIDLY